MNLAILAMMLASSGCKEDTLPEPINETETGIVWQVDIKKRMRPTAPLLFQNSVIFGCEIDFSYHVFSFDKETGDTLWHLPNIMDDYQAFIHEEFMLHEDKVIISAKETTIVLDANNGNEHWRHTLSDGILGCTIIDGNIYKATQNGRVSSAMTRYNLSTGVNEVLFSINRADHQQYTPLLTLPVLFNDVGGDEILVMQNRSFDWSGSLRNRMDVFAYNLSKDTTQWYITGIDNNSSSRMPLLDGEKVYFYGSDNVFCIHPKTGDQLWTFSLNSNDNLDFVTGNLLTINDKLIVKPDNSWMLALDKNSGDIIWQNENTYGSPGYITYHNDSIYFAFYGIIAVDANTGEVLSRYIEEEPNHFAYGVEIDPKNGSIYAGNPSGFYKLDPKKIPQYDGEL